MKNVRETKDVPFLALLSTEERAKISGIDVPEELKKGAEALGVTMATECVTFNMTLGSVIFDIYHSQSEMPKAPLAAEREKGKRIKLAEELDKDEFEVPGDVKGVVEKALSDDAVWGKLAFSAHFKVADDNRMLQLNSAALDIFSDCKKALLSIFV